jgi:AcrR family transcriptional regulator
MLTLLLAFISLPRSDKMSLKRKINPRKKATQGRAKETVKSIIEATTHIIEKSGFEELSTNLIAKKAGVSIGSLYQYFPSKESILSQLIENELSFHVENIKEHIDQIDDATIEEFVDELLTTVLVMFEKKKKLRFLLFKYIPRGLLPKIHKIEDEIQKIIYNKLRTYDGFQQREDLEVMTYIIVHTVVGVAHSSLAKGRKYDLPKIKIELSKMLKAYLSTE